MPIYEYRCDSCGHEMEKLQRISEAPLTDCPDCHEPALRRLISAAGFRLKGSGWYETDFKKGNKRNVADTASDNKADKKDEAAKSTDSKAAGSGKTDGKAASADKGSKSESSKAAAV